MQFILISEQLTIINFELIVFGLQFTIAISQLKINNYQLPVRRFLFYALIRFLIPEQIIYKSFISFTICRL
ncbi:hypothetical protein ASE74_11305 [Pedobacter sp. Leaf216]|nr:hypothetical protein ASE74_11305 [Pedobacter sp. Leaf216]